MPRLPIDDLRPGMLLSRPLHDTRGRLLLGAWEPVTASMLKVLDGLGAQSAPELWLGEPGSESITREPAAMNVPLTDAPAAEVLDRKRARREWEHRSTLARARAELRRRAEEIIAQREPRWRRLTMRIVAENSEPSGVAGSIGTLSENPSFDPEALRRFRVERAAILAGVYRRLASGETVGTSAIDVVVDELLDEARRRPRALPLLAMQQPEHADALVDHAFAVGTLCVAIATALGWNEDDVRAVSWAGFLADVGIAVLPSNLRAVPRPLTEEETNALHRHPVFGAALTENILARPGERPLDERVQIAVFQHHERENATGYPRRTRSSEIHDLAKIVAVADVFLAITEPRAHRPALSADEALTHVVRQSRAGVLGRDAVRGLAIALGLRASGAISRSGDAHEAAIAA